MKYKVGDRVRVKTNLKGGERYGDMYFHADMEEYRGKEYTVIAIDRCGYYLEGVRRPYGPWSFRDEMLDPAILPVKRDWTLIVRPDKADPDTTVAILKVDGEETRRESVKRYYKDKYNSGAAIREVVAKLLDPNGCAVAEGTLKPASDAIKTVELKAEASEKADEPVIGPPATVEPPKPEPVMIGGRKLKVGSKFILKSYNAIYAGGIASWHWNNMMRRVITVKSINRGETDTVTVIPIASQWDIPVTAIDRILED